MPARPTREFECQLAAKFRSGPLYTRGHHTLVVTATSATAAVKEATAQLRLRYAPRRIAVTIESCVPLSEELQP
jgi:hypothetical protein